MMSTRAKLAIVIALCAPAIAGTVALWALGADVLPTAAAHSIGEWSVWLFLMAAYGPLLVVPASVQEATSMVPPCPRVISFTM